jgi:hypothetical protein
MIRSLTVAALLLGATPAAAQSCPTPGGWAKPARHVAARTPNLRFALKPNSSAQLQLHAEPAVTLAASKERGGQRAEFAGLAAIDVAKAGKLEVALSDRAYVDLVRDGRALDPTAHGRRQCGGVFKAVMFDVQPGRYLVQIADAKVRSIRMAFVQK